MATRQRLTPTLFDKLVVDLEISGLRDMTGETATEVSRENFRHYSVPKLERFNEQALRSTIRRELAWLLNTTSLASVEDLEPYPEVETSVLNYGLSDLAGRVLTGRTLLERAREMRRAIRTFEPRLDGATLSVEPSMESAADHQIAFVITGDITAAAHAMPVKFRTEIDPETVAVDVRE